ncbi:hypothetical protein CR513_34991, partial [Mucuna pruriens]
MKKWSNVWKKLHDAMKYSKQPSFGDFHPFSIAIKEEPITLHSLASKVEQFTRVQDLDQHLKTFRA